MAQQPPLPNARMHDPTQMVHEELLIQDIRNGVSPSQMVERKLAALGEGCPQLQSRIQKAALSRPA